VRVIKDTVASIDPVKKVAVLASGPTIAYDKLILSPGIDLMWDSIAGSRAANSEGRVLQAWKAGRDGGVEAPARGHARWGRLRDHHPRSAVRCPPDPMNEPARWRATSRPPSPEASADPRRQPGRDEQGPLFKKVWAEQYKGIVEYRGQHKATAVDATTGTIKFEIQDDVKADVLNVLPTMRAGLIAVQTGLANANARWCNVNYLNFESTAAKHIQVIGDSIQIAPGMPKSGTWPTATAKWWRRRSWPSSRVGRSTRRRC